jgi:hypothetical protein
MVATLRVSLCSGASNGSVGARASRPQSVTKVLIGHDEVDERAVCGTGDVELAQRARVSGPDGALGIRSSVRAHGFIVRDRCTVC